MTENIWFANQLSDDACATQAILNILLNCPGVDTGDNLREFRSETELMSPVIRGLAISNKTFIRDAHNSLARPADIRGSLNAIANSTFKAEEKRKKDAIQASKFKNSQKAKGSNKKPGVKKKDDDDNEESYHFIGYVPADGKVWEMDGLKSGPLEVGELPIEDSTAGWMAIVRPALRMKMKKYGGAAEGGNIRFSLLAIVEDGFAKVSDEFEYLCRDKVALQRRLGEDWEAKVNPIVLALSTDVFNTNRHQIYTAGFSHRRLHRDAEIQRLSSAQSIADWEKCVTEAISAKQLLEEELLKSIAANTDNTKRAHDYKPFFEEFTKALHMEGILNPLLNRDENGKVIPSKRKKLESDGDLDA